MTIGLTGALVGGLLTLLSPCSAMLLPAFFAYAFTSPGRLLARTGVFYLGLLTTLVPLGVLAGSLGAIVAQHRTTLVTAAASLVIALGIVQVLGIPLTLPGMRSRTTAAAGPQPSIGAQVGARPTATATSDRTTTASVYLLGTVYGLAGVCAGPVLGSVLVLAATGGDPLLGGVTLAVFALGMVAPLLVLAALWSRAPWVRALVRPRTVHLGPVTTTWTQLVGGILGIGIGVLLIATQGTASLTGVLGAAEQAALEASVLRAASAIPDIALVGVAVVALAAAWAVHAARARRPAAPGDAPTSMSATAEVDT
ncbi:cytochrome c biogenesis protein CcdA [Flavimobilis sp. GY10621]|uniref:Cytochrome c biogenesis protein CcdA n=1 Tax=Flavimobilis rhizosphaerae TaxID=2775421 RepID=A0ABR9DQ25_9MICO|nr:cytochrome c biogenesis CcdA family protein [Flavimobilis rhizosphaerae]MBD9699216.1 cytochrome c biogenesis protein CcdA [Flavimobilis rhizosphaerae]